MMNERTASHNKGDREDGCAASHRRAVIRPRGTGKLFETNNIVEAFPCPATSQVSVLPSIAPPRSTLLLSPPPLISPSGLA